MKTLKAAALAAVALAALSTAPAQAATEGEDVTAIILSQSDTPLSLPSMQPAAGDKTTSDTSSAATSTTAAPPVMELLAGEKMAMRRLWEDHMSYTHSFIISSVAGLSDLQDVQDRLLKNQDDIGNAIKPYYGDDAGNKLATLLRAHITVAADMVKATKDKDRKALDDARAKANSNADEIADMLAKANPNWSRTELSTSLHHHVDLLAEQADARVKKDWKADIAAYDRGEDHILSFADMLVEGIAKQYPEKFTAPINVQPSSGP
ncbi:MAG: glycosyltransferase [Alphaproteobacteria bacterium]